MSIEEIEAFAQPLCAQDEEDPHLYEHVQLVRKYAKILATIEKADKKVCEIAALLHDIGKCKGRETHHITGMNLAKEFLESIDLPEEKKALILKCILKHRSRFSSEDDEIEVKVIQSADCLGTLFNEKWQEHCRKTIPKKDLLEFYNEKALKKINLESARKIAEPQLQKLKEQLTQRDDKK
jgi:putative nucleotidyltransferase with HDIG domain